VILGYKAKDVDSAEILKDPYAKETASPRTFTYHALG